MMDLCVRYTPLAFDAVYYSRREVITTVRPTHRRLVTRKNALVFGRDNEVFVICFSAYSGSVVFQDSHPIDTFTFERRTCYRTP
jgi:hypothetical protein